MCVSRVIIQNRIVKMILYDNFQKYENVFSVERILEKFNIILQLIKREHNILVLCHFLRLARM